jgi:hypothetical protein
MMMLMSGVGYGEVRGAGMDVGTDVGCWRVLWG